MQLSGSVVEARPLREKVGSFGLLVFPVAGGVTPRLRTGSLGKVSQT